MYDTHFPPPPWPWLVAGAAKPAPQYARPPLCPTAAARRESVVAYLRAHPWATPVAVAHAVRIDANKARSHLNALVRAGVAERIGGGRYAVRGGER